MIQQQSKHFQLENQQIICSVSLTASVHHRVMIFEFLKIVHILALLKFKFFHV